MRQILHVDMDAFFAAVELLRHPDLAGKPLVIGGRGNPQERGVVSTASYEARKYGIHSAMPLRMAYRLCPQAVFLPVDYAEYARVSLIIKGILAQFSPVMEDVGIDEAFIDVSTADRPAEEIAAAIKARVRQDTGLTCSIGIAPNKLLAKIASDLQKPDGLTIVRESDIPVRIWPLPVRKISGVGPVTEARLREMGVKTIGQLAVMSLQTLQQHFGPAHGEFLYEASRGIDERPLVSHFEAKSRRREVTFQHDISDWQSIAGTLAKLCAELAQELEEEGCCGRTVGIKVRFADFETHTREKTLDTPTDSSDVIQAAAFDCLKRISLDRKVRLLGVRVGELAKAGS